MMYNMEKIIHILKSKNQKQYISDSNTCKICGFILNNPYQTECGCLFCKDCIESYIRENNNCPGSYEECKLQSILSYNSIKEDKARAKEIAKMQIKCIYEGCDYKNELNKMNDHLYMCEYQVIECDLCKEFVRKINIGEHKETECKEREVICEYCQKKMKSDILMKQHNNPEHDDICVKYIDKCPYKCDNNKSFIIFDHRPLCINKPLQCPFVLFGCNVVNITKEGLEGHILDNVLNHNIISSKYLGFQNDAQGNKIISLRKILKELTDKISILVKEIEIAENIFNDNNNNFIKYNPSVEDSDLTEDISRRTGTILWKIVDFSNVINNAKSGKEIWILSKPFYSSEFGYKMCLKMYPYGDGQGRGTHISLFFVIMKGDYDDILQWPFNLQVKISLLACSNTQREHSEIFNPDSKSNCYKKPEETFNIGSGSPKFCDHENLERNYISNNMFFIKASINNS